MSDFGRRESPECPARARCARSVRRLNSAEDYVQIRPSWTVSILRGGGWANVPLSGGAVPQSSRRRYHAPMFREGAAVAAHSSWQLCLERGMDSRTPDQARGEVNSMSIKPSRADKQLLSSNRESPPWPNPGRRSGCLIQRNGIGLWATSDEAGRIQGAAAVPL